MASEVGHARAGVDFFEENEFWTDWVSLEDVNRNGWPHQIALAEITERRPRRDDPRGELGVWMWPWESHRTHALAHYQKRSSNWQSLGATAELDQCENTRSWKCWSQFKNRLKRSGKCDQAKWCERNGQTVRFASQCAPTDWRKQIKQNGSGPIEKAAERISV